MKMIQKGLFRVCFQPITMLNCCTTCISWEIGSYNTQQSRHNEHTHFCRNFAAKSATWFSENEEGTFPKIHPFWWRHLSLSPGPFQAVCIQLITMSSVGHTAERIGWKWSKPYPLRMSEGDMRLGGRRRAESAAWRGGFGSLPQRPCQCSSLKRPSILPQSQLCHQRK